MADRRGNPNSAIVSLTLPPGIASQFPKDTWPHITCVHLTGIAPEQIDDIALVVSDELWERFYEPGRSQDPADAWWADGLHTLWSSTLQLAGLRYFENADERVAYAAVVVPRGISLALDRLRHRFDRLGINVSRLDSAWIPHATLAYLAPGEVYTGTVPAGSWTPETLEVWRGDEVGYLIGPGAASGIAKLERRGDRWTAYRDAGRTRVGEFGSEAEARLGLADDGIARKLERNEWPKADGRRIIRRADVRWLNAETRTIARIDAADPVWLARQAEVSRIIEGGSIPPCSITYGTNEYGVLETSFMFQGDASAWTVTPAKALAEVDKQYIIDLYLWSRDPRDEVLGAGGEMLPECIGTADKIEKRGGKWVALSEDGSREFGTYETEAEARERLRQVEAAKAAKADEWDAAECMHVADACGVDLSDIVHRADRSEDEKAEIRSRWQKDGPNMGAARMREWLDSPFAGPNRKSGDERARARRVAERALRLMEKPTGEWTDPDYTGALQVLAFIERMSKVEQGAPLVIDGRKGPSARDASLRDWGFDPKADGQQVLFDTAADGSITIHVPAGVRVQVGGEGNAVRSDILDTLNLRRSNGERQPAPAVHTESRVHTEVVYRADKVEFAPEHKPVYHPDGWVLYPVLYSRAGNVQVYGNIREYRDPRHVFDRASMDTGIGDPWELRHSADLLSPRTVLGAARGAIVTVDEYHDGQHTFGWSKAWDLELIEAIEGRDGERPTAPEVSVAYRCKIDKRPGHSDSGEPFDQRQYEIVWNSLASEPYGRAQTARVLSARADAITVHSAADLLAIASGRRVSSPVYVVPELNWARFDSASTPRPSITDIHKDADPMSNKALIKAAQALGIADEAISNAIGIAIADMPALMESETELTPDQVNALIGILPKADMAKPDMAMGKKPDMDPGDSDANMSMGEMAKIMIGEAEVEVPKVAAEHIAMLTKKLAEAGGRADRATKRADKAETDLAEVEKELAKRSDAMSKMVSRADAEAMKITYGTELAGAMELARRVRGVDFNPESRKDAASGDALPLTLDDWRRAVISEAFGDRATAVLSRIDAAPNEAAREFAMTERMRDARELIDARSDKSANAIAAVEQMRARNAAQDAAERSDSDEEDTFAAARRERKDAAEKNFVGAHTIHGAV